MEFSEFKAVLQTVSQIRERRLHLFDRVCPDVGKPAEPFLACEKPHPAMERRRSGERKGIDSAEKCQGELHSSALLSSRYLEALMIQAMIKASTSLGLTSKSSRNFSTLSGPRTFSSDPSVVDQPRR